MLLFSIKSEGCAISKYIRTARPLILFFGICVLTLLSEGCSWLKKETLPTVLKPNADLSEIVNTVNGNSSKIRSFISNNAQITLTSGTVPLPMSSQIAYEYPRKFRAFGSGVAFSGKELDIGSNEELFWVWAKRDPDNKMYFCRRDQYESSGIRNNIPIDPDWLLEAMGIVFFLPDPKEQHRLAGQTADGHWAIETKRTTPIGIFTKRTVIDNKTAAVLLQELRDPNGRLVASAISPTHTLDKASDIVYPTGVDLLFAVQNQNFTIHLAMGDVQFNPGKPFAADAFKMPTYAGYQPVDLCGGTPFSPSTVSAGVVSPNVSMQPNAVPLR
ncbi:MAG: hypothetical protein FWC50_15550 [Planctomycetaceae bacterium]|nr:hypothetical protein [Planctomycetaceae bacterium]